MTTLSCSWCNAPNVPGAATCASCGAPLREEGARLVMESVARALPPDTVLRDGDYKILAILGQGGFGITYRALNSRLGREVAIKEFFPSSCDREGLLVSPSGGTTALDYENGKAAFLSEARVLARFDHPAIVRVFGAWEENRSAYMEMELLRGQTLAHVLEQYRRLSPADVLRLFGPILDALQVLHNEGYLHRDIKPQNLMLCGVAQGATDAEGCVRHARAVLLDFGAAHHVGSGASQALSVVVTPGYAPLEQYAVRARRGAFTDIYALCATLYHALSGQAPPPASDRAIGQALTPLEDLVPGLPKEWYRAIDAGLQTEIARRPQSIGELRALMGGQNPSAPAPYQPYQTGNAQPYGTNDLSALTNSPPHHVGFNHQNSQSLIAQSLLNAVPDPNAPQVLAAPNLNPPHPLSAIAPGAPVALSQPASAVPLVPPQASQNAIHHSPPPSAVQQQAQNQAQPNNAANDVRMRQIAALLYLGSPILFALLWWLFAVSQGPHNGPPPMPMPMTEPREFVPPPITRPYNPPPAVPAASPVRPEMKFSVMDSDLSSLRDWTENRANVLTNTALSPDGKWAAGIANDGAMLLWNVKTGHRHGELGSLGRHRTAQFSFAPDSSKLMVHEITRNDPGFVSTKNGVTLPRYPVLRMVEVKTGKVLWEQSGTTRIPSWSKDSSKLEFVHGNSQLLDLNAATGKPVGNFGKRTAYLKDQSNYFSDDLTWFVNLSNPQKMRVRSTQNSKSWSWNIEGKGYFDKNHLWFAPDNSWLMAVINPIGLDYQKSNIAFRDTQTGKNIGEWKSELSDFTISPTGRYVVIRNASNTNSLRVWNVRKHDDFILQWTIPNGVSLGYSDRVLIGNRVVFSPDESKMVMLDEGKMMANTSTRSWSVIRLIDISRRRVSEMKSSSTNSKLQMQFTRDGQSVAWIDGITGQMGHLKLSEFTTSVPVQVLAGGPPTP